MAAASAAESRRRSSSPTPRARAAATSSRARCELGAGPGQHHRPARSEVAVDVLGPDHPSDLGDGGLHGPTHGRTGPGPAGPVEALLGRGEQGRAPSAVAPRGPEADHVPLDDGDAQARVGLGQVVGRPQPGEPAPDHGHVHVEVAGQRGPDVDRAGQPVPPQREVPVALARRRAQICFHASVRTERRMEVITSNSSSPQVSGGASCTTGSPRSSARQMSPAS